MPASSPPPNFLTNIFFCFRLTVFLPCFSQCLYTRQCSPLLSEILRQLLSLCLVKNDWENHSIEHEVNCFKTQSASVSRDLIISQCCRLCRGALSNMVCFSRYNLGSFQPAWWAGTGGGEVQASMLNSPAKVFQSCPE